MTKQTGIWWALVFCGLGMALPTEVNGAGVVLPKEETIKTDMAALTADKPTLNERTLIKAERLLQRGIKYHDRGWYSLSKRQYKRSISANPFNESTYYELGFSHYSKGELLEAYTFMLRALTFEPELEMALVMKASVLDDMGYLDLASMAWKELLYFHPGSFMGWLNKGITDLRRDAFKEAEAAFHQALLIDATHPSPYYGLLATSNVQGFNYDEMTYINQFLALLEDEKDPRYQVALDRKEELLEPTIYVDPSDPLFFLNLFEGGLRANWWESKHREVYPTERGYRPSLKEEAEVGLIMLGFWQEDRATHGEVERFIKLERVVEAGFLDAHHYCQLEVQLGAEDLKWGKDHADEIKAYRAWLKAE